MRKIFSCLACAALLLPLALSAAASDPLFQVRVNPAAYRAADFTAKGFNASEFSGAAARDPASMPTHEQREALFDRVPDLRANLGELDELDRDLLVLRARRKSFEDLKSKYPKLPATALRKLQELLRA